MPVISTSVISESNLMQSIIKAARDFDWLCYHTRNSRQSEPGFVDLVLVRPPRVMFLELKTAKGRLRKGHLNKSGSRWLPGQDEWGEALDACEGVEYLLVRPADLDAVYAKLMR